MNMDIPSGEAIQKRDFASLSEQDIKEITERYEAIKEELDSLRENEMVRKFDDNELSVQEIDALDVEVQGKMKRLVDLMAERNKLFGL